MEVKSPVLDFLHSKGFEGRLLKKPHDERNDGPATFFDTSIFELFKHFELPYAYKTDSKAKGKGGSALYEKGNCCLIMVLRSL